MSIYVLKGLTPWLIQRISAVVLAVFTLYVSICLSGATEISFEAWQSWLSSPFNSIVLALSAVATLYHAWIGMRDVILDYIHHFMLRILFLVLIAATLMASGFWLAKILLLQVTA